jgi:hypothetical protein
MPSTTDGRDLLAIRVDAASRLSFGILDLLKRSAEFARTGQSEKLAEAVYTYSEEFTGALVGEVARLVDGPALARGAKNYAHRRFQ